MNAVLPKAIFVTGTDTGAGKTIVTGCLAKYLQEKGFSVITQKWIQTGCSSSNFLLDIQAHLKIMSRDKNDIKNYLKHVVPYIFKPACSPHLASQVENRAINPDKIKKSFKLLSREFDFIIVEGTGGALVPFNKKCLVIDIVRDLKLPVLVVAQNKLGGINHTLLTIEALKIRGLNILGIIFNNPQDANRLIMKDNPVIIKALTAQNILGILPWRKNHRGLYKEFVPIAKRIFKD